ncbi:MAG: hypothetical protein LQ352_000445 [Teloschistes flavicans]|nr:MAG: hypothetical protein LQ352_000445 [Teloschistes flavicans]
MSGFFSSEAERALLGEEEEVRRLFYLDPLNHPPPPGHPAYQGPPNVPVVPSQRWPSTYSSGSSYPQYPQYSVATAGSSSYATSSYSTAFTIIVSKQSVRSTKFWIPVGRRYKLEMRLSWITFGGIPKHSSAAIQDAQPAPRVASRVGRIATDMKQNTDQTSYVSGEDVTESSVEWTI